LFAQIKADTAYCSGDAVPGNTMYTGRLLPAQHPLLRDICVDGGPAGRCATAAVSLVERGAGRAGAARRPAVLDGDLACGRRPGGCSRGPAGPAGNQNTHPSSSPPRPSNHNRSGEAPRPAAARRSRRILTFRHCGDSFGRAAEQ
jgi:hypothetical protein